VDKNPDLELLSPRGKQRISGIVTIHHRHMDATSLHKRLTEHGVICAPRGGGIRFSPHYYNDPNEIEHVFELLLS
jgi:selenocysteine lyase/cysteine desulfurase